MIIHSSDYTNSFNITSTAPFTIKLKKRKQKNIESKTKRITIQNSLERLAEYILTKVSVKVSILIYAVFFAMKSKHGYD